MRTNLYASFHLLLGLFLSETLDAQQQKFKSIKTLDKMICLLLFSLLTTTFSYFTGMSPRTPRKAIFPKASITRSIIWIIVEMLVFLLCLVLASNKNRKVIDHTNCSNHLLLVVLVLLFCPRLSSGEGKGST